VTGESEPVEKAVATVAADAPLAERSSLLHAGIALQALFVFARFMQSVFGSESLGLRELVWATVTARART
jgi:hypothetical protein